MWAGAAAMLVGGTFSVLRATWAAGAARALIVSGVALVLSDVALIHGQSWAIWLSGFAVCAAMHRWLEAASAPDPNSPSTENRKPKV